MVDELVSEQDVVVHAVSQEDSEPHDEQQLARGVGTAHRERGRRRRERSNTNFPRNLFTGSLGCWKRAIPKTFSLCERSTYTSSKISPRSMQVKPFFWCRL